MQHKEWVGADFHTALNRIIIVGYSHHREDADDDQCTIDVVNMAIDGQLNGKPFFNRTHRYIEDGTWDRSTFWNSVVFVNFLPRVVGKESQKYGWGSIEDHKEGLDRLRNLIDDHQASHVFILTPKPNADHYQPYRVLDLEELVLNAPLLINDRAYSHGKLKASHGDVKLAFLPHPQSARTADMRGVFQRLLSS